MTSSAIRLASLPARAGSRVTVPWERRGGARGRRDHRDGGVERRGRLHLLFDWLPHDPGLHEEPRQSGTSSKGPWRMVGPRLVPSHSSSRSLLLARTASRHRGRLRIRLPLREEPLAGLDEAGLEVVVRCPHPIGQCDLDGSQTSSGFTGAGPVPGEGTGFEGGAKGTGIESPAVSIRRRASHRARSSGEGEAVLSGRISQRGSAALRGSAFATPLAANRAAPRTTNASVFFTTASSNLFPGFDEGVGERSPICLGG